MIEAAIVIPLLLLAIISLIYFGLFCHNVFKTQIEIQSLIIEEYRGNSSFFSVLSEGTYITGVSDGIFKSGFYKEYKQRLYVVNEEMLIRGGTVIDAIGH